MWLVPRAKFLADVALIADRTNQPECAVIARLVDEAERKAKRLQEPWQIAAMNWSIAAMMDEIGPALERDARRQRMTRGR
jgi:hypothetical protein